MSSMDAFSSFRARMLFNADLPSILEPASSLAIMARSMDQAFWSNLKLDKFFKRATEKSTRFSSGKFASETAQRANFRDATCLQEAEDTSIRTRVQ